MPAQALCLYTKLAGLPTVAESSKQGRDPSWDLAAAGGYSCLSHLQGSRGSASSCHVAPGMSQFWKSLGLIPTVFWCLDHRTK